MFSEINSNYPELRADFLEPELNRQLVFDDLMPVMTENSTETLLAKIELEDETVENAKHPLAKVAGSPLIPDGLHLVLLKQHGFSGGVSDSMYNYVYRKYNEDGTREVMSKGSMTSDFREEDRVYGYRFYSDVDYNSDGSLIESKTHFLDPARIKFLMQDGSQNQIDKVVRMTGFKNCSGGYSTFIRTIEDGYYKLSIGANGSVETMQAISNQQYKEELQKAAKSESLDPEVLVRLGYDGYYSQQRF